MGLDPIYVQKIVLGADIKDDPAANEVNIRTYFKYVLKEGGVTEKRALLGNLKSKLIYENRAVKLTG